MLKTTQNWKTSKFYSKEGLSLYGFILFHKLKTRSVRAGLETVVTQVASGALVPHIEVNAPWTTLAAVSQQLTDSPIANSWEKPYYSLNHRSIED